MEQHLIAINQTWNRNYKWCSMCKTIKNKITKKTLLSSYK